MSKKDDFLRIAHSWMGRTADCKAWIRTTVGYNTNQAWCAAFVMSCAKSAGIFGKVMNGGFCVQTWFITGVSQKLGTFHKAGWHGIQYKPAPGDLICFRWNRRIPKNRCSTAYRERRSSGGSRSRRKCCSIRPLPECL